MSRDGRAWALVGLMGALGASCIMRSPVPAPAPTPPAAAAPAPPVLAAPRLVTPPDDPKSCIDPMVELSEARRVELHKELARQMDAALPDLMACQAQLRQSGEIRLALVTSVEKSIATEISSTTLSSCEIVNCYEARLNQFSVPPSMRPTIGMGYWTFRWQTELKPNQPPRLSELEESDEPAQPSSVAPLTCVEPETEASGLMSPEVIRNLVRQQYGLFRACYEAGLGRNRELKGRVTIRFVIDRDGKVVTPYVLDNELPDCVVATCIRDGFSRLAFPRPENGIVTVQYPIVFEPG